jgi:hypothetical protein
MIAATAGPDAVWMTLIATLLAAITLTGAFFATAPPRAGLAARRLLAAGFFTDLRADFVDLAAFFLVPAVALEARPADFVLVLLMAAL